MANPVAIRGGISEEQDQTGSRETSGVAVAKVVQVRKDQE